jgi:hypothetical protein
MKDILEFCFSGWWVWFGSTIWLLICASAVASFHPMLRR